METLAMPTMIPLTPEAERRLESLESRTGRSKGFYLGEIVERGLDEIEDYYLAHQVLERVEKGEENVHAASQVRIDLGLDG